MGFHGSERAGRGVAAALMLGGTLWLAGCDALLTSAPDPGDVMDGPVEGLTGAELTAFILGDEGFEQRFSASEGLGPLFNQVSCADCHSGDGRGRPEPERTNVVPRLNGPDAAGLGFDAVEIQRRAIAGVEPEEIPAGARVSIRLPPPVFGLGLIEAIPVESILAREDPDDADGDGISGRAHWVEAPPWVAGEIGGGPGPQLGRFTRTARVSTILEQVADAYHKDMGITTEFFPFENVNRHASVPTQVFDPVPEPELPAEIVRQVAFYVRTLAPPAPGEPTPRRQRGEEVFASVGCASCHVPEYRTGPHPIAALSHQAVRLYSDLLLHDMGPELDDGVADRNATSREWRTAPLWGLRVMREFLNGDAFLLHDGRARSVEEAIDFHGGEAAAARAAFRALSPEDRAALLDFVESR